MKLFLRNEGEWAEGLDLELVCNLKLKRFEFRFP